MKTFFTLLKASNTVIGTYTHFVWSKMNKQINFKTMNASFRVCVDYSYVLDSFTDTGT